MSTRIGAFLVGGLLLATACSSPNPTSPQEPLIPLPPRLHVFWSSDGLLLPDTWRVLTITATSADGTPISAAPANITISDPAIAAIRAIDTVDVTGSPGGQAARELVASVYLTAAGHATVRVALGGTTQEFSIDVNALPAPTTAAAIDSFTVLEFTPCLNGCNNAAAYAPVLRLHAVGAAIKVVALDIVLPTRTTSFCGSQRSFAPDQSADLILYYSDDIGELVYDSQLVLVNLGGPVPDGPAIARVIVQSADGTLGLVEATGVIQRNVASPVVPVSDDPKLLTWTCS